MKKRMLALVLAVCMVLGLMTGCQSSSGKDTTTAGTQSEEKTTAAAAGEGTTAAQTEKEVVDLRFVFYGDMTTRREEFFKNEFHDKVLEDLGINMTVETLPWGSDTTIATMLASGESFACYNIVSAYDWPAKGYLAKIDMGMIEELCPNLIRTRGETNGFECVKYKGDIYAIPFGNKPYSGGMQLFDVRNDILKSVGYDAKDIHTYEQLEEAIAAVHEADPNLRILRSSDFMKNALQPMFSDQVTIFSGVQFAYVDEKEEGDQVYSWFESEYFKNYSKFCEEWVGKGFISQDELTNPTQGSADWETGNCLICYGMPGALISMQMKDINPDAEEALIRIDGTTMVKLNDYDWGISISASDQDVVDRWLTFFDWMYKDQETFNFCAYGVEGKDWEFNEDGTIKKLCDDSFIDKWFLEAIPYNTYAPSIPKENIERYENWDKEEGAVLSKASGFIFDTTPVASELAMMTSIYTEYFKPMSSGFLSYDENYEDAIKQLKDAGLDKYMEEYQRQFSEWYAAK